MLELKLMAEKSIERCPADAEAIQHLKQSIAAGKHWYIALLEAIGLWGSGEENIDGHHYEYLIGGDAFDWLLLAERLCLEVADLLPEEEKENLLFFAIPPIEIPREEFCHLIGQTKYRAYLNFLYGIVVEEVLVAAIEDEVLRERRPYMTNQDENAQREAYIRVYGSDMHSLMKKFRLEHGYEEKDIISLTESKEFSYWLFKYRIENSDKERVASDTKKALQWLQRQWASRKKRLPADVSQAALVVK